MIDGQTYACLQDVIRREGRSLLQYAVESSPWTTTDKDERPARLRQLAAAERDAAGALARLLVRHRLRPPWLGAYPMGFTSFNFLALDRLLPLLIAHEKRGLAELEGDLARFQDDEARGLVQQLLEAKTLTLQEMEALAAAVPAAPA